MNYGLGNKVIPYKDRKINIEENVYVYRNLNRKGKIYSIKQKGLVVGHTTCLTMKYIEFFVNKSGQKRARINKKRNVHAYIIGKIALKGVLGYNAENCEENNNQLPVKIEYNPFKYDYFMCTNLTSTPLKVKIALGVIINKYGVFATHIY